MLERSMLPQLLFDSLERAAFEVQKGDAPDSDGQWYTVAYAETRSPHTLQPYVIADWSEIVSDFGQRFRIVEIGDVTDDSVRIRVTKFVEQEKPRVRATAETGLKGVYDALRAVDPSLPEFDQLGETKAKIFVSQIVTMRMTMKM